MKREKQCQHLNTIQVGNPGIIEIFCVDCNEVVKVKGQTKNNGKQR